MTLDWTKELRAKALTIVSGREVSRFMLKRKLLEWCTKRPSKFSADVEADRAFENECIDVLLNEFEASGFVSDHRFAEIYLRTRGEQNYGPRRIAYELAQKGVPSSLVSELLENADQDWIGVALRAKRKKFGRLSTCSLKDRSKVIRHLMARGFEMGDALAALENDALDEDPSSLF
ncbi:MAG: regulatory protein RecX [Hahellaceae bacterium]|nr:regulatory protein RecX [Hahellaceae bacterium]